GGIQHHALRGPQREHRATRDVEGHPLAQLHAQRHRELRVGHRARPAPRRQVELDREHDPGPPALERARTVAELELAGVDAHDLTREVVEEVDADETLAELLPVGADVLNGSGPDGARDAAERLDARQACLDGGGDERIPVLARGGADARVAPVAVDGDVDTACGHPDDGAVDAVIGADDVRAAPQHEPVLARGPHLARRLHELLARRRLEELPGRAADPQRRELGERTFGHLGHGSRRTTTWALPSTVSPPKLTVRSTRAVSSSRRPTFATTVTSAPSEGSTTTGRVNRTW